MDALVAFLQSTLGFKARHGWNFFLIGAVMLTLFAWGILTKEELPAGWFAACFLATVGGVVLAVSAGYSIKENIAQSRKVRHEMAERKKLEADAVTSAEILRGRQAAELRAILSAGEQRFTSADAMDLRSKNIVRYISGGIYIVVDPVWNDRERLIKILEERQYR